MAVIMMMGFACSKMSDERLLSSRELANVSVSVVESRPVSSLAISGLVILPGFGIQKVFSEQEGDVLNVSIVVSRKDGLPPSFRQEFLLPEHVSKVAIGKDKDIVWKK